MSCKKLSFEVNASEIDFKPLMQKDFLELSMRSISSANPNRNNSWFTKESMEKSKNTFANKPILGYFENNDFVSHNGEWNHDEETGMDYWDTLGRRGERMLGMIRESDPVEIVEGSDGLYWIQLKCVIWVQYAYKQVKRLIKDAKRAKSKGGPAKNVSVEVDITDYEMLGNGVMKINEFNLIGITILGSRNGVKVEPGIENAGLSVIDIMGRDVFEKQEKGLRLAYERLEGTAEHKKEEFSNMEDNTQEIATPEINNEAKVVENASAIEESGENSEINVAQFAENDAEGSNSDNNENASANFAECDANESEAAQAEEDIAEQEEQPVQEPEAGNCECEEQHEEHCEENPQAENDAEAEQQPENNEEDSAQPEEEDYCGKCAELEAKCNELAALYEEAKANLEACNERCASLEASCAQLQEDCKARADYAEIKEQLSAYQHKEFLNQAYALIASANLDSTISTEFYQSCEKGSITDLGDLKVKVALKVFDTSKIEEKHQANYAMFNSPVSSPDTTGFVNIKSGKTASSNDPWSNLKEYVGE